MADVSTSRRTAEQRYVGWFHELDAWTEYWDIYHPETKGRFYFGNRAEEQGLLTRFLPRETKPAAFTTWAQMALRTGSAEVFSKEVRRPEVAEAILEIDRLIERIFEKYFGDPSETEVQADYLEAMFRCALNTLPPATERASKIKPGDWRVPTAGNHMIDSDIMWFAWAEHLEASHILQGRDAGHSRRALQMAGVAAGCGVNFGAKGHRRTRPEYRNDQATVALARERGMCWANNFDAGAAEVHSLYRFREWGHE